MTETTGLKTFRIDICRVLKYKAFASVKKTIPFNSLVNHVNNHLKPLSADIN